MHNALDLFPAGTSRAIGVWLVLILFAMASIAVVLGPLWREQVLRARVRAASTELRDARADAGARRLRELAGDLAVVARRAEEVAQRRHADWVAAGDGADAAWWLFHAADDAAQRALSAARYGRPQQDAGPDSVAARRRLLHRLASDAHRRGQLSTRQLADVLTGRDGWEPDRPLLDLEVQLRLAIREHFWQAYQAAAAEERLAWDAVAAASRAKVDLAEHALDAEVEAPAAAVAGVRRARPATGHVPAASPV